MVQLQRKRAWPGFWSRPVCRAGAVRDSHCDTAHEGPGAGCCAYHRPNRALGARTGPHQRHERGSCSPASRFSQRGRQEVLHQPGEPDQGRSLVVLIPPRPRPLSAFPPELKETSRLPFATQQAAQRAATRTCGHSTQAVSTSLPRLRHICSCCLTQSYK